MDSSKVGLISDYDLTQYLLGKLQGEQCERLDELSIADDEFAERLSVAENELVDAYVRNQLRSDVLRDFESHYLATDVRREKVAMARAFLLGVSAESSKTVPELSTERPNSTLSKWPQHRALPLRYAWLAVAAVLVLCATTAWLAMENRWLRQQHRAWLAARAALEQELQQLHAQVENERTLQTSKGAMVEESGQRGTGQPARLISTMFLVPPTRGAATIPVAVVADKDQWLRLQLELEADDFPRYLVDLMNPGKNTYVWHSGPVTSAEINHRRALSVLLPAGGLKPQRYGAEISGIAANGHREVLGTYVFSIAQTTSRQ